MIQIKKLSYAYPVINHAKEKITLENISFNINNGEFVSILGPSGCGKTTLVNVLAGYLPKQSGEILINNFKVKKSGKSRVVVNQENDLFGWMTVLQNMQLVSKDEKDINEKLDLVGLSEFKHLFPNNLSGGMKKRLSLARALIVHPEFLILDEPFVSLDHRMREELHVELDKIFSLTKKTTLLVTHDIDESIFLSDRIIVLGYRPAHIVNELRVSFPHPRKASIKTTKKFISLRKEVKKSFR